MAAARTGWKTGHLLREPAGLAPSRSSRHKRGANEKAANHVRGCAAFVAEVLRASKPDHVFVWRDEGSIARGFAVAWLALTGGSVDTLNRFWTSGHSLGPRDKVGGYLDASSSERCRRYGNRSKAAFTLATGDWRLATAALQRLQKLKLPP